MKSVIRHIVEVDHRDDKVFPSRGTYIQTTSEVAGLGGGLAYVKLETNTQANVPITSDTVSHIYLLSSSRALVSFTVEMVNGGDLN